MEYDSLLENFCDLTVSLCELLLTIGKLTDGLGVETAKPLIPKVPTDIKSFKCFIIKHIRIVISIELKWH